MCVCVLLESLCPSVVCSSVHACKGFARYLLNCSAILFLPDLVWWCIIIRQCAMWINWFSIFNVKVTARGLFNQNMTVFTTSSKLLVRLQPDLVCWYSIISRSVLWENGIAVFMVKVIVKVKIVSECLSGQYLLNHFVRQTCMVMQHHKPKCHAEKLVHCVQCQARAFVIKIWLFLLYLLSCWSVCNQNWFDSTT